MSLSWDDEKPIDYYDEERWKRIEDFQRSWRWTWTFTVVTAVIIAALWATKQL